MLTKDGIVVFYNGENDKEGKNDPSIGVNAYCGGQALFDQKDPTHLIARLDKPFIQPVYPWEKTGLFRIRNHLHRGSRVVARPVVPLLRLRGQRRRRGDRSLEAAAGRGYAARHCAIALHPRSVCREMTAMQPSGGPMRNHASQCCQVCVLSRAWRCWPSACSFQKITRRRNPPPLSTATTGKSRRRTR